MPRIAKFAETPDYKPARTRLGASDTTDTTVDTKKGTMKCLFTGENDKPGNFMLVASSGQIETGFHPRHKHSFDQIRYAYKGDIDFLGGGKLIREGSVAYFPAGTYYGPYDGDWGGEMIAMQFEGAHRADYYDIGSEKMRQAIQALSKTGTLKNGVYTWVDENGKTHNQDSMAAILGHMRGKPEVYPAPRFEDPIVMNPQNFSWLRAGKGAFVKELATFTERKTTIGMVKLAANASFTLQFPSRTTLVIVVKGSVLVDGDTLTEKDAIRMDAGERQAISSTKGCELLYIGLPALVEDEVEQVAELAHAS